MKRKFTIARAHAFLGGMPKIQGFSITKEYFLKRQCIFSHAQFFGW